MRASSRFRLRKTAPPFATRKTASYRWDKWDYIFVGAAGTIASLADFLLVRVPHDMKYLGTIQQKGSPITAFLKNHINSTVESDSWFAKWARHLEQVCKVPYDATGLNGAYPRIHRFQTLGHDPILGLIFGVLDIYRGTMTGFSYDRLTGRHTWKALQMTAGNGQSILEAFLLQIGHLISDVGTRQGIPAPFFSLFQRINLVSPLSENGRTVGEIARWMYLNGFDFRHFIAEGMTPAVIEIIVRIYLMLRHYAEQGEVPFVLFDNTKYRSMLLAAHAIACAGNIGKIALYQGNPLAINYAEWLALFRYVIPSLTYWAYRRKDPRALMGVLLQRFRKPRIVALGNRFRISSLQVRWAYFRLIHHAV